MTLSIFISLVAYACATTFSPGPNNVLLLTSTASFGFRKCIRLLLGIWTGLITVMLLCGFFCAGLGSLVPKIAPYARFLGAAYILWLAWQTFRRRPGSIDDSGNSSKPLTYINGFLLQFLNVKILMLGVAAFTGFILPIGSSIPAILIFAFTMAISAACGNLIWATVGSLLFPFYAKHYRVFNVIMTLLLIWCAYKIMKI